MRIHLTYSNVVATLALFLALGGVSYALVRVPRNSVGTAQLKNGAVTSNKLAADSVGSPQITGNAVGSFQLAPGSVTAREVEPGSLLFEDFSSHEVSPPLYAEGAANGTVTNMSGVLSSQRITAGVYTVEFNRSLTGCVAVADAGTLGYTATAVVQSPNVTLQTDSGIVATDSAWTLIVDC